MRAVVVLALLGATGWLHGRWTDRWGASGDVDAAAAALAAVPDAFGEWARVDIPPQELAKVYKSDSRQVVKRYRKGGDGPAVCLLLICGRRDSMIIEHNPTTCYKDWLGFQELPGGRKVAAPTGPGGRADEFYMHTFVKPGVTPTQLRLMWGWGDGRGWSYPDEPRVALAGAPVLYKLYATRDLAPGEEQDGSPDPILLDFLTAAVPAIDAALAAPTP
jgi:hypothetical protein